jgi:hypothetical protein
MTVPETRIQGECSTASSSFTTSQTPKHSARGLSTGPTSSSPSMSGKTSSVISSKHAGNSQSNGSRPGTTKSSRGGRSSSSDVESRIGNGPSTAPSGNSQTESTNGQHHSSPPSTIDPTSLSTTSLWTLTHVAHRLSDGYSENEVANHLGVTRRWIRQRLELLRDELTQ